MTPNSKLSMRQRTNRVAPLGGGIAAGASGFGTCAGDVRSGDGDGDHVYSM